MIIKMKLWVVIGTYDKIEEAKLQMDLIRKIRTPFFEEIKIVHAYNWKEEYVKYLEDKLVTTSNPWHFIWAANLIDDGIQVMLDSYDVDYILVTASDCWWMLPEKILEICKWMRVLNNVIATCVRWYRWQLDWRRKWLACDTFIIDANSERTHPIFPLKAQEFRDKNSDMLVYFRWWFKIERLLSTRYVQSVMKYTRESNIVSACNNWLYVLSERIPTMENVSSRNFDCIELWLYTNHDFDNKRKILKKITWI